MAGLNKVLLIGRLGQDPTVRYSQAGSAVTNFSMAVSESWTDKQGQKQEKTEWINCVAFGKQAETLEKYLTKGSQVYIEGRIQTYSYEKDGKTLYSTKINISNFQFLDSKKAEPDQGSRPERQQRQQTAAYDESDISDIPF
jgi:single-strand DNA-binding protein